MLADQDENNCNAAVDRVLLMRNRTAKPTELMEEDSINMAIC